MQGAAGAEGGLRKLLCCLAARHCDSGMPTAPSHRRRRRRGLTAGADDVDELLETLMGGEESAYRLFAYANDLSGEVDALEDNCGALRCVCGSVGLWGGWGGVGVIEMGLWGGADW